MRVCVCVCTLTCLCPAVQEQGDGGQNGAERGGQRKAHSQLPYFLGRGAQDQALIKAGYCVKQGAVVSSDGTDSGRTLPGAVALEAHTRTMVAFITENISVRFLPCGA